MLCEMPQRIPAKPLRSGVVLLGAKSKLGFAHTTDWEVERDGGQQDENTTEIGQF